MCTTHAERSHVSVAKSKDGFICLSVLNINLLSNYILVLKYCHSFLIYPSELVQKQHIFIIVCVGGKLWGKHLKLMCSAGMIKYSIYSIC